MKTKSCTVYSTFSYYFYIVLLFILLILLFYLLKTLRLLQEVEKEGNKIMGECEQSVNY